MLNINLGADLPVLFAAIQVSGISVTEEQLAFVELMNCAERYADQYAWTPPSEIPGVQQARQFFRSIGLDPTKRRPSSEALLHRAIKRKGLDSVNALVDVGNWCSLDFLLPTCIYDSAKIVSDVWLRLGQSGDSYLALNSREMNFEGRLVLTDDVGAFGSPMTDSQRTAVSTTTKAALLGIWAQIDYPRSTLQKQAETFADRVRQFCDGEVELIDVLPHQV
jgi:DNA/RNA-binding domain of Phe-tRNA-synthetase-like protein